jgi:pimeloyl-ACP methyl ester carboxylesterase
MNGIRNLANTAVTLAALALMLAAFALALCTRSSAQTPTPAQAAPTRFTVVTEGPTNGPVVLLLPGLTSSRAVFDSEAKILAPTYRLYRVQIDGFSGQPAGPNASGPLLQPVVEELHQYLAANHLHPAVIGHSLGGLLGLMLADSHPEDVQKLLIVDSLPFYALVFNPAATVESVKPQAEAFRSGVLGASPDEYAAQATQTAGYLVLDPDARKLVAASSIASDRNVMAEAIYEDLTTDLRPRLATIKTPTTLLYPYDATAVPDPTKIDTVYTSAYSAMPNLKIHRIDASRHFIMYDQPAAFDAAVQTFLK